MTVVVDLADESTPGLRERKKQRTRASLIEAAAQLCLQQGYENTTVDQIAAAADVSARTFSRYFATKRAVYLALLDALIDAVGRELAQIPGEVAPLRAIKDAHLAVLCRVGKGGVPGLTSYGVALMLQVINSTPELRLAAGEIQSPAVLGALAARMGVQPDCGRLQLVHSVWTAIIVTGCSDLRPDRDGAERGPDLMAERINESFEHFAALTAAAR